MFPLALHKRAKNFQAKSLKRHERTKEGRTRAIKKSISRDSLPYRSSAGVCPDPGHATKPRGARGTAGCAHHHRSRSWPDAGQQLHPSPGDAGRGLHPRPHHLDCTADPAHSFATSHQRTPGQPDGQRWLQRPNLAQLHPVCRPPAAAAKHATRRRVVAKPSPRKNRQAPSPRPQNGQSSPSPQRQSRHGNGTPGAQNHLGPGPQGSTCTHAPGRPGGSGPAGPEHHRIGQRPPGAAHGHAVFVS